VKKWQEEKMVDQALVAERPAHGQFEHLMSELQLEDPASFQNCLRFEPAMFQEMVDRLTPSIARRDTNFRKCLEPGLKIAIALRYMATGDSSKTLMYGFRVAYNTICLIIKDVCKAIVEEYQNELIVTPPPLENGGQLQIT
jgi:hypothetical protein